MKTLIFRNENSENRNSFFAKAFQNPDKQEQNNKIHIKIDRLTNTD